MNNSVIAVSWVKLVKECCSKFLCVCIERNLGG